MFKRFIFAFREFGGKTQIPGHEEFFAQMVSDAFRKFAEDGYFPRKASVFFEADSVEQFIASLEEHVQGYLDIYTLHLLKRPDLVNENFMPAMNEKQAKQFKVSLGRSLKELDPSYVLNFLQGIGLKREKLEQVVSTHFDFDFQRAKYLASCLDWALRNEIDHTNGAHVKFQGKVLQYGPNILRWVAKIYDTPERYFHDDPDLVSAQASYPKIAIELKKPLHAIADCMQTFLDRHPEQLDVYDQERIAFNLQRFKSKEFAHCDDIALSREQAHPLIMPWVCIYFDTYKKANLSGLNNEEFVDLLYVVLESAVQNFEAAALFEKSFSPISKADNLLETLEGSLSSLELIGAFMEGAKAVDDQMGLDGFYRIAEINQPERVREFCKEKGIDHDIYRRTIEQFRAFRKTFLESDAKVVTPDDYEKLKPGPAIILATTQLLAQLCEAQRTTKAGNYTAATDFIETTIEPARSFAEELVQEFAEAARLVRELSQKTPA